MWGSKFKLRVLEQSVPKRFLSSRINSRIHSFRIHVKIVKNYYANTALAFKVIIHSRAPEQSALLRIFKGHCQGRHYSPTNVQDSIIYTPSNKSWISHCFEAELLKIESINFYFYFFEKSSRKF